MPAARRRRAARRMLLSLFAALIVGGGGQIASDVSVWSATRGVRVIAGGEARMPFKDEHQLRAELQCVDGAASLHYVIRSKIRYGSIISVASSNPNAVEPTLPSSRPTADESGSGGQQQQGGGGQAASKRSSWSTMLDEGETPLTVATRCRGVGDAVVTVSLSMQTPAAEVTRELVLLETVCCTRESVEAAQQVQDHGDASGCIAMCSHRGSCVKGVCLCAFGFHGASCEKTCPGGHEAPCSLRGRCDAKSGKCACIPGYYGPDCSSECPGGAERPCSGRGRCGPDGSCACEEGYTGAACHTAALPPSSLHLTCPGMTRPHLVRDGEVQPEYANVEASRLLSLRGVSRADCVWHIVGGEVEYAAVTASSSPSVVELALSVQSQGKVGGGRAPVSLSMACKASGKASLWLELVFTKPAYRRIELFFGKVCEAGPGGTCGECVHGTCEDGVCTCEAGYWGEACAKQCRGGGCGGNGLCHVRDGGCICYQGHSGEGCVGSGDGGCGGGCGGRGRCVGGECECEAGWRGDRCLEEACECSGRGTCKMGTVCECEDGWGGEWCETGLEGRQARTCPGGCSGRGVCDGLSGVCRCLRGYDGADCGSYLRVGCANHCSGHGRCSLSGECVCIKDWGASDCSKPVAEATQRMVAAPRARGGDSQPASSGGMQAVSLCPEACWGRGMCVSGACRCFAGYEGPSCGEVAVREVAVREVTVRGVACTSNCSGHGRCLPEGGCECQARWWGRLCSQPVQGDGSQPVQGDGSQPVQGDGSLAAEGVQGGLADGLRGGDRLRGGKGGDGLRRGEGGGNGSVEGKEVDGKEGDGKEGEGGGLVRRERREALGGLVNSSLVDSEWRRRISRKRQRHSADEQWINLITWLLLICVAGVYFLSGKRMRGGPGGREEEAVLEWMRKAFVVWHKRGTTGAAEGAATRDREAVTRDREAVTRDREAVTRDREAVAASRLRGAV